MTQFRNLKFTRKLANEDNTQKTEIPISSYPENWDEICQVIEVKQRELGRNLNWAEANAALNEANVSNSTQALLIMKSKGMIEAKMPRRGVDY